jgi:hypothetical protein
LESRQPVISSGRSHVDVSLYWFRKGPRHVLSVLELAGDELWSSGRMQLAALPDSLIARLAGFKLNVLRQKVLLSIGSKDFLIG